MISAPPLTSKLIAPCGMNCGICLGYLRDKNHCSGCLSDEGPKANHCTTCRIKNCEKMQRLESGYCYDCENYPCSRLKQLDKRYITNYGMSMIENLDKIRSLGFEQFMELEKSKWTCSECGERLCVHREKCQYCGAGRGQGWPT
ncbi:MAG: DUF3795 domain-containing protein [Candidatus Marinimicrobia bacterium]|nr:DUF3795 domain-containing protein [Candidatus Neomarinimicrobiota bacterium]